MVTNVAPSQTGTCWEVTCDLGAFSQEGRRLLVAGSFNDWSTRFAPARNGFVERRPSRAVKHVLPPGVHEYKYFDLAAGEWLEVDRHPELYRGFFWDYVRNPFGTLNCVVRVPSPNS